jgi:MarR family transcriptional regulator for hemolysin
MSAPQPSKQGHPPKTEPEERFAQALHNTAREWRRAVDRQLKYLGISQAGWMAIAAIAKAHEPLSQAELADSLGVEAATVVAMVDRLVKADLVRRETSTGDRRINFIVLTANGAALYESVKTEAVALRYKLLSGIPVHELSCATELLENLQRALAALEPH